MPPASSSASSSTLNHAPSLPPAASLPKRSVPIEDHNEPEPEVPWVAALTTYFGYALLFLFGYIREFSRAWLPKTWLPRSFAARGPVGYAPLADDYDAFYTRRLYHRIQDCWGRPISYVARVLCKRVHSPMHTCCKLLACLNFPNCEHMAYVDVFCAYSPHSRAFL